MGTSDAVVDFTRELELVSRLAREAGALVLRLREGGLEVDLKPGDEPVTAADREASALLVRGLGEAFPEDVVISEENLDDARRLTARRVWYIDPIDGTKDFIRGEAGFCVMVGLCEEARPRLGVVYQPVGERLFWGTPAGAFCQEGPGEPRGVGVSGRRQLAGARLVASKSNRDARVDEVKQALGTRDELNIGSVGLKLALLALGERDVYVNPTPHTKVWDTCAPEALLHAAGGRLTDVHGQPLRYDEPDVRRHRGLLATNGLLHAEAVERLAPLFPPASEGSPF